MFTARYAPSEEAEYHQIIKRTIRVLQRLIFTLDNVNCGCGMERMQMDRLLLRTDQGDTSVQARVGHLQRKA